MKRHFTPSIQHIPHNSVTFDSLRASSSTLFAAASDKFCAYSLLQPVMDFVLILVLLRSDFCLKFIFHSRIPYPVLHISRFLSFPHLFSIPHLLSSFPLLSFPFSIFPLQYPTNVSSPSPSLSVLL